MLYDPQHTRFQSGYFWGLQLRNLQSRRIATITHAPLVLDEVDPQILKTLNLADRIAGIQKTSTPKPDK